jgi:predicted double-glycine peptidase
MVLSAQEKREIIVDIIKQQPESTKYILIGHQAYQVKIIDFPSLRQTYTFSCGASAIQVMMLYYGFDKRENAIIEEVGTTKDGTKPESIVDYFKNNKFKVSAHENFTIDKIKTLIDEKIPVLVVLQAWVEEPAPKDWEKLNENGHYVVVIGYTDRHIVFSDPSNIYDTYLTYEDFEKRWHDISIDKSEFFDHYAIIPYGIKPSYKGNYVEHMN